MLHQLTCHWTLLPTAVDVAALLKLKHSSCCRENREGGCLQRGRGAENLEFGTWTFPKTNPKSNPWFFLNHGSQFLWWFFKNVLNLRRKKLRTIETTRDVHTERGVEATHTHTFQIFAIFYLKEEKHEGLMFWMQTRYVSCVFGRSNSTGLTFFPI